MLRFFDAFRRSDGTLSRREWLRLGGLAGIGYGLGLSDATAADSNRALTIPGFGKAKSVIFIYCNGGQSQLETWDPKPAAPLEVRGEFAAIKSAVPGVLLGEHLPRVAQVANKFTIVRNVSHEDLDHGTASYLALTGRYHRLRSANPPPAPTDDPTYAAILKRVRPSRQSFTDAVHVNGPAQVPEIIAPGQDGGFLGREYEPMLIGDVSTGPIAIPGLTPQSELPPLRIEERWNLKQTLENYNRGLERDARSRDMSGLYERALSLLASPACREAFDLGAERDALRDRYGRYRTGQACLLARRLVEAGVPWITVMFNHTNRGQDKSPGDIESYGWDTHNDIFYALKEHLLPRFDQSFSALLEDLDARGLLDTTLVVCMGEFGRAPLVALEPKFAGSSPGRKHWAACYSVVLAGAGVMRGGTVGTSDRFAGYPTSTPSGPWDIAATMFSALGIDPESHYTDAFSRPFPITIGEPIAALYSQK